MTDPGDQTVTARELWEQLAVLDEAGRRAYLGER